MLTRMEGINIKNLITDQMSNRQIIKDFISSFISSLSGKAFNFSLGHASITTTIDTYSHLYPSKQKTLANKLDDLF